MWIISKPYQIFDSFPTFKAAKGLQIFYTVQYENQSI